MTLIYATFVAWAAWHWVWAASHDYTKPFESKSTPRISQFVTVVRATAFVAFGVYAWQGGVS